MKKSTFTPLYAVFREKIVGMRKSAGLTQRGLAKRLKREHSFIARIEQGERRVDIVEFFWICKACGASPERTAAGIIRAFTRQENASARTKGR